MTPRLTQPCRSSISLDRTSQPCMISALLAMPPKACTALQDLCSAGTYPQGLPHQRCKHARSLFHWAMPPRTAQPCTIFTPQACAPKACQARDPHMQDLCSSGSRPPKPVKPGIHRHADSPLRQPAPLRHTKPTLQRPATSPQLKAYTCRTVGPHPPSTYHRKTPNLPDRHTQTGLDAKELASEQLRLQFYCSRTGDIFPFFKGFAAWSTV
jgi:hypothetical protein